LLAQATMRDYPEGIRSAVLESVLPLEESFLVRSSTTVADAILQLVDACTADAACDSAYPNLREVLFEVIDRLNAEPVAVTLVNPLDGQSYEAMLSGDAILGILRLVLYQTATLPAVPQAIYGVYNGEFELMTQLGSLRLAFLDAVSAGMQYSVFCTDDLIGRTEQDLLDARAALPRQLAGAAEAEVFLKYGIMSVCKKWPVEEADPSVKLPLQSDIPTLVLSGEFDPVTPPAFARLVAGHLSNSTFFEFPGTGHVGESTNACALSITAAFLEDPTEPPDGSCIAEMAELAFDVPGESAQVELTPYANESLGLKGLVPDGWTEVQPGTFARASSALDVTAMQMALAPSRGMQEMIEEIAKGYGLAETPSATGQRQANGLDWSLYALEVQGGPRDLALAESKTGTLIFVLRCAADERDALFETVFLPMVDTLTPLE
jgi:pimeloyl-ACP methyl ester carboxylesterase